jgi:single-strand DNA-binding protein
LASLNRIILIGRLVADPEARTTVEATPITKFTLAVDRNMGPSGKSETDFIDIIAWSKLAEVCGQLLKKGTLALIEGRIATRTFDTKDGAKKYVTEVVARSMKILEKGLPADRHGKETVAAPASAAIEAAAETDFIDDDLPF